MATISLHGYKELRVTTRACTYWWTLEVGYVQVCRVFLVALKNTFSFQCVKLMAASNYPSKKYLMWKGAKENLSFFWKHFFL